METASASLPFLAWKMLPVGACFSCDTLSGALVLTINRLYRHTRRKAVNFDRNSAGFASWDPGSISSFLRRFHPARLFFEGTQTEPTRPWRARREK